MGILYSEGVIFMKCFRAGVRHFEGCRIGELSGRKKMYLPRESLAVMFICFLMKRCSSINYNHMVRYLHINTIYPEAHVS